VIRAVAWDIDGTLVDSEPRHHRALLAASRDLGVALDDLPDQAFRGVHMLDVWEALRDRYPPSIACDGWLEMINAHYVADWEPLVPMPGALEAVAEFHRRGIPQICVSNSNRLDDVTAGKPDPEPYLRASRLLGQDPQSVAAVEDSVTGIISAQSAGLRVFSYGDEALSSTAESHCRLLSDLPSLLISV
jgi:HAD superfamily hydrolase (TIGR01509 family)